MSRYTNTLDQHSAKNPLSIFNNIFCILHIFRPVKCSKTFENIKKFSMCVKDKE